MFIPDCWDFVYVLEVTISCKEKKKKIMSHSGILFPKIPERASNIKINPGKMSVQIPP